MAEETLLLGLKPSLKALNAGFFMSPGYGRHPRRRIDSCELILVHSGTLGIEEEGREHLLKPGQCLILIAGREHGGTLDYSKELQFYWLHFQLEPSEGSPRGVELAQFSSLRRPERMVELLRRYLDDQESGSLTPERAALLVELMLLETLDSKDGREAEARAGDEGLSAQAERLILSRFHEPELSASALAKSLKCNSDYLNRVFKRARGCTLTEAIQRQRVKRVCQLLLEAEANIDEIALQSGFSDGVYMRRLFKRLKGMTPKDYRRLHRRMHINTR